MILISKIINKIKSLGKPASIVYPLIIIISIPLLLIINTFWNLRTFNRDVNFLIRHHAVSTADTLKPAISRSIANQEDLTALLFSSVEGICRTYCLITN